MISILENLASFEDISVRSLPFGTLLAVTKLAGPLSVLEGAIAMSAGQVEMELLSTKGKKNMAGYIEQKYDVVRWSTMMEERH